MPDSASADPFREFREQLDRIEAMLRAILVRQQLKEHYTTEDVAAIMGKAEFTVREWCRLGRIDATKKMVGRGKFGGWSISHAELLRLQRDGLHPDRRIRTG